MSLEAVAGTSFPKWHSQLPIRDLAAGPVPATRTSEAHYAMATNAVAADAKG
jgi:hypothetical protein